MEYLARLQEKLLFVYSVVFAMPTGHAIPAGVKSAKNC